MKRINIFVLLCTMIFVIYTDAITAAALTDFPEATNGVITLNEKVSLNVDRTLSNVTIKANVNDDNIEIPNGVTLTLDNVTIEAACSTAIWVYGGSLVLKNTTITGKEFNSPVVAIWGGGTATIENSTVQMKGSYAQNSMYASPLIVGDVDTLGEATITNSTIESSMMNAIMCNNGGKITINGGTITGNSEAAAVLANGGVIYIKGNANIQGTTKDALCALGGTINVTGGTVNAARWAALAYQKQNSKITISGENTVINGYVGVGEQGSVEITGGTINGALALAKAINDLEADMQYVKVVKGKFKKGNYGYEITQDIESVRLHISDNDIKENKVTEDATYVYVDTPQPPAPASDSNSGGGGGGSTQTEDDNKTPEEKELEVKNTETINNVVPDDAPQETKDAADAAIEAFKNAETGDHELTEVEAEAIVKHQEAITQESKVEAETGEVEEATVPAASNLLEDSAIAELDNLSAKPKVTEPKAPEPEEQQKIEETLSNIETLKNDETVDTSDIPDTFDVSELRDANAVLEDGREIITIDPAEKNLEKQASLIEDLFEQIKDALTSVIQGSGGDQAENGVVIATRMPTMTPHITGWFPLKVNMRHLMPGQRPRFWISPEFFRRRAGVAEEAFVAEDFALAAEEGDAFFLDGDGNPTTTIKGDPEKMTVVAYLREEAKYDSAFITVDASESDKQKLEEIIQASDGDKDADVNPSSGGGGCNSIRNEAGAPLAELGIRSVLLIIALFSLAFVKISSKR